MWQWFCEPMAMAALPAQAVRPFTISVMLLQPSKIDFFETCDDRQTLAAKQICRKMRFSIPFRPLTPLARLFNMISSSSSQLQRQFEDVPGASNPERPKHFLQAWVQMSGRH
jgi:hypothetical protein